MSLLSKQQTSNNFVQNQQKIVLITSLNTLKTKHNRMESHQRVYLPIFDLELWPSKIKI